MELTLTFLTMTMTVKVVIVVYRMTLLTLEAVSLTVMWIPGMIQAWIASAAENALVGFRYFRQFPPDLPEGLTITYLGSIYILCFVLLSKRRHF